MVLAVTVSHLILGSFVHDSAERVPQARLIERVVAFPASLVGKPDLSLNMLNRDGGTDQAIFNSLLVGIIVGASVRGIERIRAKRDRDEGPAVQ